MNREILKTLVGSRAHGLYTEASDYDYRSVHITPSKEILSLGYKEHAIAWEEGDKSKKEILDNTSYEIGHYLNLALHSNPSVLEVLVSPTIETTEEGNNLKALFPYLWNSTDVLNAFGGYSHNQLKKFFDNKDSRPLKYATAMLRVLLLGIELLRKETMTVNLKDQTVVLKDIVFLPNMPGTDDECSGVEGYCYLSFSDALRDIKYGKWSRGKIINWAEELKKNLKEAFDLNPNKQSDYDKANEFLLEMRRKSLLGEFK